MRPLSTAPYSSGARPASSAESGLRRPPATGGRRVDACPRAGSTIKLAKYVNSELCFTPNQRILYAWDTHDECEGLARYRPIGSRQRLKPNYKGVKMIRGIRRELRLVRRQRRFSLLFLTRKALLLSGVALAALAFGSATASASTREYSFRASAWGTQLRVGNTVKSGRSALIVLGCTSTTGVVHSNRVASVKVPKALLTGTIHTRAASKATGAGIASTSSAATQHVSLLGGMVSATAIRSVSTTGHNTSTGRFSTSALGTRFVKLVIAGHAISGTPAANTKITLPGIGYVVLNEHKSHIGAKSAGMTVIGIHLVVTTATKRAKAGTQAWVSVANSALTGPVTGVLHGLAFGTSATVGKTVKAGRSFPKYMPCLGTGGATRTNTGVAAHIPGVLRSATITDSARGIVTSTKDSARMSSKVQDLNLLSGVVSATVVKADVTARGNPPTLGDHSSFIGLHVAGHPGITDAVPPNTKVDLPGIGTLWLHRRIKTSKGISVVMIQLIIGSHSFPAGLPAGAVVDVGYANVGVS